MYWNSDDSFPLAGRGWQARRPPFGRLRNGESAVFRATSQWHPFDPLLVSIPEAERMLPPICFPSLEQALQRRVKLQYGALMVMIVLMALGFWAAGAITDDGFFVKVGAALLLLLGFVQLQRALIFRKLERLRDYSRFFSWCHLQPQASAIALGAMMVVAGAAQYYLQLRTDSLFEVIEKYGLEFEKALGQPWRYMTGPFLHAGPEHWIANFTLLMVGAGFFGAIGQRRALWSVFLVGAIVPSFVLTFLPRWVGSDAILGISGGVFAIFGWIVGITFKYRHSFPFGLWGVVAYFAVANMLISSLLDPRASWFAHSLGFVIGCGLGMLAFGFRLDVKCHDLRSVE